MNDEPDGVQLSVMEQRVAWAFAVEGKPYKTVAAEKSIGFETVKSYVKRVRAKCREAGIDVGTRHLLRAWLEQHQQ